MPSRAGASCRRRRPPAPAVRSPGEAPSPVVGELQWNLDIAVAQLLDHRLKLVLVLARNAQLVTLGAHLRLGVLGADPLGQVPGELLTNALAQLDDLADVALGRRLGFLGI